MKKLALLFVAAAILIVQAAPIKSNRSPHKRTQTVQTQTVIQLTFVNDTPFNVSAQYGLEFVIPPGINKYQFLFNPNTILVFGIFQGDDKPHYGYGSIYPDQMTGNNQVVVYHSGTDSYHIQFDNYFNAPFEVLP